MATAPPSVCVLAGGLATRLGAHAARTPKGLLEVAGRPFLLHQLELLAGHGVEHVVLCVGHLGEQIVERIGRERYGIAIDYSHDGEHPIGTLGAVRQAAPLLGERFLVLYGDTYLRLDYRAVAAGWSESGLPGLMTVLRNGGRWDSSNARFDGELVTYDKRQPPPGAEWIDYGLTGLEREALSLVSHEATDLADLLAGLSVRRELFGYPVTERFYEIGTPDALAETREFLARRALSG